jgi:hypothetical protein
LSDPHDTSPMSSKKNLLYQQVFRGETAQDETASLKDESPD